MRWSGAHGTYSIPRKELLMILAVISLLVPANSIFLSGGHRAAAADGVNTASIDLYPISYKFTKTSDTIKVDNVFSAAEVSVKNCGVGTCSGSNSWNVGLNSKISKYVEMVVTLDFNLIGTDIDVPNIKNMTFVLGGCWHGGGGQACGGTSNPDFTSTGGKASIRLWDANREPWKWEPLGSNINLGTASSSSADKYAEYSRTKSSDFRLGHITNKQISISIKTFGTTVYNFNMIQVIDYAKLHIVYEKPPPINPSPVAYGGADQFVYEGTTVTLDASGSSDPNVDVLSYNWAQTSGPPIVLENSNQPVTNFIAPEVDTIELLTFLVNVTDQNSFDVDDVMVYVRNTTLNQPNIIVFFTDDQRWDTIQNMTTVMNRIAGEGALFTNAFVNLALCCPSRATLLTGQYAHNHNIWTNLQPNGGALKFDDTSTVATWLRAKGYRTGFLGKYMNEYNLMFPAVPKGWDTWNVQEWGNNYYNWKISENGKIISGGTAAEDYFTDVLRDRAIRFIQNDTGQPFFLIVAFPAPHIAGGGPWYPPPAPRHDGTCDNIAPWRPPSYNETDMSDKPPFTQWKLLNETDMQRIDKFRRHQICSLKAVDEAVDAVMNSVGDKLDNTLIIFTSDNGYFWGEHRREGKFELYEEAVRVPFAIRYPPLIQGPQVRNELISNVDIATTISDITGAPPYPYIKTDGKSLTELFTHGNESWRTSLLLEQRLHGNQGAVRTADFKYIESLLNGVIYQELYYLVNDPYELENVATNSSYTTTKNELMQILNDLKDD